MAMGLDFFGFNYPVSAPSLLIGTYFNRKTMQILIEIRQTAATI